MRLRLLRPGPSTAGGLLLLAILVGPVRGADLPPGSIGIAWHRCPGEPGAAQNLQFAPREGPGQDTLVLTWDPGGSAWDDYLACLATVHFYDAREESLAPFWRFGSRGLNKRGLLVNIDPPPDTSACPSVWRASADGGPQYDMFHNFGRLRFTFYVASNQAYPLDGGVSYHVANLFIRHDAADSLQGWDRPMIVEFVWWKGYFGLYFHKEYAQGERRFATLNDPTGEYLRRFLERRRSRTAKTWEPRPRRPG